MPANVPVLSPTASLSLPSKPYILSLTTHSTSTSSHLILQHPSPQLTIVDSETLQVSGQLTGGHTREISAVTTGGGASTGTESGADAPGKGDIWSAGKDALVVRWDERNRTAGQKFKALHNGKPLPLLSLALPQNGSDNLLVAGSELVSSEAWLLFWDTRNPSKPLYAHSSTHSDDITFLTFLPPTSSYLPPPPASADSGPTPSPLLLSGSTDGLLALTNPKEEDEDEAFWGADSNLGGSVAAGGAYLTNPAKSKGKSTSNASKSLRVWGRSDQDGLATFALGRPTEPDPESPGDIEFQQPSIFPTSSFKPFTHSLSAGGKVSRSIRDETLGVADGEGGSGSKAGTSVAVDYLIDVSSSLGVNGKTGQAIVGAGSNTGDIVLLHHHTRSNAPLGIYEPSAFLMSSAASAGHRDVVRCLYHDVRSNVLYTGSEDGVLSGWNLPSPADFLTGDPDHDDDGGDGREAAASDEEDSSEDDEEEDEMDVDDEDEDEEVVWGKATSGKRLGSEVWGGGGGGRKRRG